MENAIYSSTAIPRPTFHPPLQIPCDLIFYTKFWRHFRQSLFLSQFSLTLFINPSIFLLLICLRIIFSLSTSLPLFCTYVYNIICTSSFPYQLYYPRRNFPGFSIECIPAAAARLMREVIAWENFPIKVMGNMRVYRRTPQVLTKINT